MRAVLYRHFSVSGELLYVGASLSVIQRQLIHSNMASWYCDVAKITLEHYANKADLMVAERKAIKSENPKYNVQYSGGNTPAYVAPVPIIPYESWSDREKRRYKKLTAHSRRYIIKNVVPSHSAARIHRLNLNTLYFIKEGRVS